MDNKPQEQPTNTQLGADQQTSTSSPIELTKPNTLKRSDEPGNPAYTMGIVGLVLSLVIAPVGLVVSLIARSQSRDAGYKNDPALAGAIVAMVQILLAVVFIGLFFILLSASTSP